MQFYDTDMDAETVCTENTSNLCKHQGDESCRMQVRSFVRLTNTAALITPQCEKKKKKKKKKKKNPRSWLIEQHQGLVAFFINRQLA